ncbi:aldo/keto reductase [Coprinopsis cinerea okayama7|uniref:Aldo/keto reductase n=1 Tax=Coprinopsis cinerea (strain Okayama-7 / 130 / ATCC MYA-4618 / FGSC 9003) TaxID=240176 RepID=A8NKX9_COPC7|nr:aldo/keto reductase [Coprinopsis cinerea okayama7\|eukprot:XP_001834569.2 aldo/keto reductase [Coprinopsis cinerea okayama7\
MTNHAIETFRLGPFITPRIWIGLWQLSSNAWGSVSAGKVRQGMARHVESGYLAFGKFPRLSEAILGLTSNQPRRYADHYGSAEIIFGQFRESRPPSEQIVGATKWCVFKQIIPTRQAVWAAVQERMVRMRSQQVDLLQFHWQDYTDKGYLTALSILNDLRMEGHIRAIGLCNFDAIRTDEICTELGPGVIVSNQVQFSVIDTRPLHGMSDVCDRHGLKLLTYGTLCGGFLADKWLGEPEPDPYSGDLTPSQRKYLDMIVKAWGTWDLFQTLLSVLRKVGDRHGGRSIANVATRWVLDHHFVGAVIIGARLGLSEHRDDNLHVSSFRLTDTDRAEIEAVLERSNGRRIISTIGDCGAEYR